MLQSWRDLLFLHFPVEPSVVQATLPAGLTVDTFSDADGVEKAWVGLVPFRMEGIRFRGQPAVPGLSAFPETNVRTYVHRDGADPGVWFYSLEAANPFACAYARQRYRLPYWWARMRMIRENDSIRYVSRRLRGGVGIRATWSLSEPIASAAPGSFEFFLVERYLLYAAIGSRLFSGRVHHAPYPLRAVASYDVEESLVCAAGLPESRFLHALASEGVDVEVFPLRPL